MSFWHIVSSISLCLVLVFLLLNHLLQLFSDRAFLIVNRMCKSFFWHAFVFLLLFSVRILCTAFWQPIWLSVGDFLLLVLFLSVSGTVRFLKWLDIRLTAVILISVVFILLGLRGRCAESRLRITGRFVDALHVHKISQPNFALWSIISRYWFQYSHMINSCSHSCMKFVIGIARKLCWGGLSTEAPKVPRSRCRMRQERRGEGVLLPSRLGHLGEHRKLPQWGLGQSPAENEFWSI